MTEREREDLLAHLAGAQPIASKQLPRRLKLRAAGLIVTEPKHSARPQASRLTDRGRSLALRLKGAT